jgi:hypothetical protein
MTNTLCPLTPYQTNDIAGLPNSTAVLWLTLPDTNTPITVYEDEDGETEAVNPIPADATGEIPPRYVDGETAYRARLFSNTDTTDDPLWDVVERPSVASAAGYEVGTSGEKLGLLNADKTDSGDNTFTGDNTFSGDNTHSGTETFSGPVALPAAATVAGERIGFREFPIDEITTDTTLVLADAGRLKRKSGSSELDLTFPPNADVALPVGTVVGFSNDNATADLLLKRGSGVTMRIAGVLTNADCTVAPWGEGTATKMATNVWKVRGTGIT